MLLRSLTSSCRIGYARLQDILPIRPLPGKYIRLNSIHAAAKCMATELDEKSRIQHVKSVRRLLPDCDPPSPLDYEQVFKFIEDSKRLVILTGAGVSTESGIPDYRGPNGAYSTGFKPTTHQQFVSSLKTRRRYWARSYIGWRRFSATQPGPSHLALAQLERTGRVLGMITQNVDRLHHKAGSNPIELHGTTHQVICLSCRDLTDRQTVQERLRDSNSEWAAAVETLERGDPGSDSSFGMQQRPDGDIEIDDSVFDRDTFGVPACENCGGMLKPDVVFFGDGVPPERTRAAASLVQASDSLLVVGSSLMVLSAFRLAKSAHELHIPIAIISAGETRADSLATLKVERRCGELLPKLLTMGLSLSLITAR